MKTKLSSSLLLSVFLFTFFVSLSYAQTTRQVRPSDPAAVRAEACERVRERVGVRLSQYEGRRDAHSETYQNIINLSQALLDKLDERGKDTTRLRADLVVLQGKVDKFQTDFDAFVMKLQEAQNTTCTNPSAYQTALRQTRTALTVVKADVTDIQTFFNTVIKPQLKALKDDVRSDLTQTPRPTRTVSGRPTGRPGI